jgi:hypothetical protein
LTVGGRPRFRPPAFRRFGREPDRQAAARPKPRILRRPVANPMPLFRDVMATGRVGFEWHGRSCTGKGAVLLLRRPEHRNRRPPCNKVPSRAPALIHLKVASQSAPAGTPRLRTVSERVWPPFVVGLGIG